MQVATTTLSFDLQRFATVTVSTADEFINALKSTDETITAVSLTSDISLTSSVNITNAKLTSIDLGGKTVTYTGGANEKDKENDPNVLIFSEGTNCSVGNGTLLTKDVGNNYAGLISIRDSVNVTLGSGLNVSIGSNCPYAINPIKMIYANSNLIIDGAQFDNQVNKGGILYAGSTSGNSNNGITVTGGARLYATYSNAINIAGTNNSITADNSYFGLPASNQSVTAAFWVNGENNYVSLGSGASIECENSQGTAFGIGGASATCVLDDASITAKQTAVDFWGGAKGTIESGTYTSENSYAALNYYNSDMVINGGTFSAPRAVYNCDNNTGNNTNMTISGGTFNGTSYGVYNDNNGVFSLSGGSISGAQAFYNASYAKATIDGGTITGSDFGVYNDVITTINGYGILQINDGSIAGTNYGVYNNVNTVVGIAGGTIDGPLATKDTTGTGYTITESPTFKSNTLLSADSTLLKYDSGTTGVYIIGAKDWNATTTENQFFYMSTTDDINGTKEFTLDNLTTARECW